jgi:hypothetical protein
MLRIRLLFGSILIASAAVVVAQSNPIPFVNQPLAPSVIVPGSGSTTLRVNGAGFVLGSVVNWNGNALATTFVNQDQLTAIVPASDVASENTASVTVSSPLPGGGVSNVVPLTVTSPMTSLSFAPATYSVGNSVVSVVAADFDNDGKVDLAGVNQNGTADQCPSNGGSGSVAILLGNGDGTFSAKWTYELSCLRGFFGDVSGSSIFSGDFNGDGKADLGVLYYNGNEHYQIALFLGNGDGTFNYIQSTNGLDGNIGLDILADFNRDGNLDFASPIFEDFAGPNVFVYFGHGDGTFNLAFGANTFYVVQSLATGDFNGDGILDLASGPGLRPAGAGAPPAPILLGNGDGSFAFSPSQPSVEIGSALTAGDFNGDGLLDLVFSEQSTSALTVLLGNGDGTFTKRHGQLAESISSQMTAADLNGDGKLDLIIPSPSNNAISVLRGKGNGTFQAPITYPVVGGPVSVAIADFNGDGKLDMVSANGDSTVTVFLNTSARRSVTTTLLTSSINPSVYGQRVTLTATVLSTGPGTPTGRVKFLSSGETVGSATLNSGGIATLVTTILPAGSYSLSAVYLGNAANLESTSSAVDQIVNQAMTSATITSSKNPSVLGKPVTLTATITSSTLTPKGTVAFMSGTTLLGTLQLTGGKARLTTSSLPDGANPITVIYSGDPNIAASSANLVQIVN